MNILTFALLMAAVMAAGAVVGVQLSRALDQVFDRYYESSASDATSASLPGFTAGAAGRSADGAPPALPLPERAGGATQTDK